MIKGIHHIAIIVSDYERSKKFYTEILELKILSENFRKDRNSYKLDLSVNGEYKIELFSFPSPPPRVSQPEATGLRHLAFSVNDLESTIARLNKFEIATEPIRTDEFTGNRFTFFADPDGLPIELYELK
ncbi:MAG: VOC family protein [Bacteroidetes bacterium]|nr:VOC family protein [Bacteroidota bacterium]